jgi:hypothetical protein
MVELQCRASGAGSNSAADPLQSVVLLSALLLMSCSSNDAGLDGTWKAERSVEGAVTVVRTISGSVWRNQARLIDELTIGRSGGDPRYVLGDVQSLWCQDDRIYILDRAIPALRVYADDGRHLFDVGRAGDGPGEFREPMSLAVDPVSG